MYLFIFQLVNHRIVQFFLLGLIPKDEEAVLNLLDVMSELCTDQVSIQLNQILHGLIS